GKGPRQQSMDGATARTPDRLVDRLLDERVRDLVDQVTAALFLRQQAQAHEALQDGSQAIEGSSREDDQLLELDPPADDGEHLEGRQGWFVELLEAAHDPVAQLLGNSLEGGGRAVTALFDDRTHQPQAKEGI